jgi:hypothetical protein
VRNEDTFNLSLHQMHHCTNRFLRRPSSEDEDEGSDDDDDDDNDDDDNGETQWSVAVFVRSVV